VARQQRADPRIAATGSPASHASTLGRRRPAAGHAVGSSAGRSLRRLWLISPHQGCARGTAAAAVGRQLERMKPGSLDVALFQRLAARMSSAGRSTLSGQQHATGGRRAPRPRPGRPHRFQLPGEGESPPAVTPAAAGKIRVCSTAGSVSCPVPRACAAAPIDSRARWWGVQGGSGVCRAGEAEDVHFQERFAARFASEPGLFHGTADTLAVEAKPHGCGGLAPAPNAFSPRCREIICECPPAGAGMGWAGNPQRNSHRCGSEGKLCGWIPHLQSRCLQDRKRADRHFQRGGLDRWHQSGAGGRDLLVSGANAQRTHRREISEPGRQERIATRVVRSCTGC